MQDWSNYTTWTIASLKYNACSECWHWLPTAWCTSWICYPTVAAIYNSSLREGRSVSWKRNHQGIWKHILDCCAVKKNASVHYEMGLGHCPRQLTQTNTSPLRSHPLPRGTESIRKLRKQTTGQTTNSSKKHVGEVCVKPNGNTSIIP